MEAFVQSMRGNSAFTVFLKIWEHLSSAHGLFLVSDLSGEKPEGPSLPAFFRGIVSAPGFMDKEEEEEEEDLPSMPRSENGRLHVACFPCIVCFTIGYRWGYVHPDNRSSLDQVGCADVTLHPNGKILPGEAVRKFSFDLTEGAIIQALTKEFCILCNLSRTVANTYRAYIDGLINYSHETNSYDSPFNPEA